MKGTINAYGYLHIGLYYEGETTTYRLHRIVALAFIGECPDGQEVLHKDNRRSNNIVNNLRYGTRAENEFDKIANGTSNRGVRHGRVKLTEDNVMSVRDMLEMAWPRKIIAAHFGITTSAVGAIATGRLWSHL